MSSTKKSKIKIKISLILAGFLLFFTHQKEARAQVIDSIHYGWSVYEYDKGEDEDEECYISSFAKKSTSSHTSIRKPYILITRFSKSRTEEVSVYSGYEYRGNSAAYMLINNQQFRLFTDNDVAWLREDYEDKEIIQKMLKAETIKVRSDSAVGTYSIDEYQMKGLARAYARMKELCQ